MKWIILENHKEILNTAFIKRICIWQDLIGGKFYLVAQDDKDFAYTITKKYESEAFLKDELQILKLKLEE